MDAAGSSSRSSSSSSSFCWTTARRRTTRLARVLPLWFGLALVAVLALQEIQLSRKAFESRSNEDFTELEAPERPHSSSTSNTVVLSEGIDHSQQSSLIPDAGVISPDENDATTRKVVETEQSDTTTLEETKSSSQGDKLNVILFYPDDWSKENVGYLDEHRILKTPNFDQLAREGIHFLQNAVTTSICWISRATLFTGQYVVNHRSDFLFRPKFANNWNQWKFSWPYLLQQQAGYWVGHVGKWQYQQINAHLKKNFNFSDHFEAWIKRKNSTGHDEYIAERARDSALQFLRTRPKDRPFATTVAFYPPKGISRLSSTKPEFAALYENVTHPEPKADRYQAYHRLPPFLQHNKTEARKRYLERFETQSTWQETTAAQFATITHIDQMVGEIIAELKAQGVYEQTLIIVTADNGEFSGAKALADKWYPYQQSIQVPLIIRDPRLSPELRGTQNDDALTLNIDLAETILGAAGVVAPWVMDGRDIADLYLPADRGVGGGGADVGNTIIGGKYDADGGDGSHAEVIAARQRPWRTEFFYEFPDINGKIPSSNSLVRKDWKYIAWQGKNAAGYEELFDLKADPVEMNNLAGNESYAAIQQEMRSRMSALKHDVYWRVHGFVPETVCDPMLRKRPEGVNCSSEFTDHCCTPNSTVRANPKIND